MQEEARQYLIDYLEEEFSRDPFVRVRVVPMTEDNGVMVRTETREYFFPFAWVEHRQFKEVEALVRKIKEVYS